MPHPNSPVIVRHPDSGVLIVLDPAVDYDPGDELVKAYPWAFVPLENAGQIVESVSVEQATAAPGEKRTRGRPKKTA
jgi:hypothetical protein